MATKKKTDNPQVASIFDWFNAKPRTLTASLRNQKQINIYLNTQLEAKNKVIRQMQEDKQKSEIALRKKLAVYDSLIGALQGHIKGINDRITAHENSGRHILPVKEEEHAG